MHFKVFVSLIILASSVCADDFEFDASEYYSGCYNENFMATMKLLFGEGAALIFFKSAGKEISRKVHLVGAIVCSNDGAYFSDYRDDSAVENYYFSYSDFSINILPNAPECEVVGMHKSGLMCHESKGGIGYRSIGRFLDLDKGGYQKLIDAGAIGLSEGVFLATNNKFYGDFLGVDGRNGFYEINIDGKADFKFDLGECGDFSYLFYNNERLYIYCDGKQKYEFD